MIAQKILASLLVLAGSMGLIGYSQNRIDALHEEALQDELLYIPNENLLNHMTAGMSNVVADLLWIETIKYMVKEFHDSKRKFAWLEHMCNAVTDLDPYFVAAYSHGGTFLSSVRADEKALKLLKKGFRRNPDSWEIPYEIVKVYVLNRRDEPNAPAVTTHYLRMLAERHEYPEMYLTWARRIQEENNLDHEARAIWEDVLKNSDDEFIRELAEVNLHILIAGDNVETLDGLVVQFEQYTRRKPVHLDELVQAGLLTELPDNEKQGTYFIDETGAIQNTLLLEDVKNRMLVGLNTEVRLRANDEGRKPRSLSEWIEWLGADLPDHPMPGAQWRFDFESGELY